MSINDDIYFQKLLFNCFNLEQNIENSGNKEKSGNNNVINNNYKKISNGNNNNDNKLYNKNMRRKVGEQIIKNRIFY